MRRFLLLVIAALPLALAPAAAAATPTTVEESFHRSAPNFATCPGFTVRGEFDVTRTATTFYDQDGTPIRQVIHVHFVGALSNSVSGKSLADEGGQIVTLDLVEGTATIVGRQRVDTEPGLGVVFADAGRVVRAAVGPAIFFVAGQHDLIEGDIERLCAYLAN
jgi:hypothetical protein